MYKRFIALGDSFTEGMVDEFMNGKFRGWADRVADELAKANPEFTYMNLAVRGKVIPQVVQEQFPQAYHYVTGKDTLISFHAGANDVIRPKYDPNITLPAYREAVRDLSDSGATIMLFTVLEKTGNTGRGSKVWEKRFRDFNLNVRQIGDEVGAIIIDANQDGYPSDRRYLAIDRLHLNKKGHYIVAQAVQERLGLPFDPTWHHPLPPMKKQHPVVKFAGTLTWFFLFALPWIWRRIRGTSSGDGRAAKYPTPTVW